MIPSGSSLALFCLASAALAVVPGPAVAYIVTHSIDKGRRAGVASAFGVATGGLVHALAATVGLSALIASSATAFTVVKLVGAAYLVGLGLRRIATGAQDDDVQTDPAGHRRLYVQGVVVNVFNPKTALFFLAFIPQFVDTRHGHVAVQVALLGAVFISIALTSDLAYALLADLVGGRLRRSGRAARARRRLSGAIFVALGITAAVARRTT